MTQEKTTVHLGVDHVIGTGDPTDVIMLIPLIIDWGVPNQCAFCWAEGKEREASAPVRRLLVLREPVDLQVDGQKIVACCEDHYRAVGGPS